MIKKLLKDWLDIHSVEYDCQYNKSRNSYLESRITLLDEEIKKLRHPGPTYQDKILGALLTYLDLEITKERVPDPSRMPEPEPTIEMVVLKKRNR